RGPGRAWRDGLRDQRLKPLVAGEVGGAQAAMNRPEVRARALLGERICGDDEAGPVDDERRMADALQRLDRAEAPRQREFTGETGCAAQMRRRIGERPRVSRGEGSLRRV